MRQLKTMIARFEDTRDLRLMGGYHAGTDAELDRAVAMVPRIYDALRQDPAAEAQQRRLRRAGAGAAPLTRHSPAQACRAYG